MAQKPRSGARFAAIFLLAFGLLFAAVGGWFIWSSYDFSKYAVATTGSVIDLDINRSSDSNSVSYRPTVAFTDTDGIKRSGQTFLSSSSYNYNIGARVEILYDSRNPSKLRIQSWFSLWGFGLIFLLTGLGIMIGAALLWRVMKRRESQPERPDEALAEYSYSSNPNQPIPKKKQSTVRRR